MTRNLYPLARTWGELELHSTDHICTLTFQHQNILPMALSIGEAIRYAASRDRI